MSALLDKTLEMIAETFTPYSLLEIERIRVNNKKENGNEQETRREEAEPVLYPRGEGAKKQNES